MSQYLLTLLFSGNQHYMKLQGINKQVNPSSFKETFSSIQKTQKELGINSSAATLSMWDEFELNVPAPDIRRQRAITIGNRSPVDWDDFWYLDKKLYNERTGLTGSTKVVTAITYAMKEMASKGTPDYGPYASSNLMDIIKGEFTTVGVANYSVESEAKVNAAIALRYILEKNGRSLNDRTSILAALLLSDVIGVKNQGLIAAENTYKLWRSGVFEAKLLRILRIETDQGLREKASRIISLADPHCLLENFSKDDNYYGTIIFSSGSSGPTYRPIELLSTISSSTIKLNLIRGLCNLINAQNKKGKYYEDFQRVEDKLTSSEADICFKYSLLILKELNGKSTLNEDEKKLVHSASCLLELLTEKHMPSFDHKRGSYSIQEGGFAEIDLKSLIKNTTCSYDYGELKTNIASRVIEVSLVARGNKLRNALPYYLSLRADVEDMKVGLNDTSKAAKLARVLLIVDSCIERYLSKDNIASVIWEEKDKINPTFYKLVQLIDKTKDRSCKSAVLDIIVPLYKRKNTGLSVNPLLFDSINENNRSALFSTLRSTIYSEPITQSNLLRPSEFTLEGKALIQLRELTPSFKDYFGLQKLKQRILEASSEAIAGKRFTKGVILSGINGAGKSFFGKVLAGELGIPLQIIKGKTIDIDKLHDLGRSKTGSLEEYFEILKQFAPLVLLLDEFQAIASVETTELTERFIKCLKGIKDANRPIILIATTNEPEPALIDELHINEDASSLEIDEVLKTRIHPYCLEVMNGFYPFNQESLGLEFTKDYLTRLKMSGNLKGNSDLEKISRFSSGVRPVDILDVISSSLIPGENHYSLEEISRRLSSLHDENLSRKAEELAKLIESGIRYIALKPDYKIIGTLDYEMLAKKVASISTKNLGDLLEKVQKNITQESLIALFDLYKNPT